MTLAAQARELVDLTTAIEYHAAAGDLPATLAGLNLAAEALTALAADVAQAAYNAGVTKRAIAEALGVSVGIFRGMTRQVPA